MGEAGPEVKAVTPGSPTLVEDPDLETVVLLDSSVVSPNARSGTSRLSLWEWSGNSWVPMSAPQGPRGGPGPSPLSTRALSTQEGGACSTARGPRLPGNL